MLPVFIALQKTEQSMGDITSCPPVFSIRGCGKVPSKLSRFASYLTGVLTAVIYTCYSTVMFTYLLSEISCYVFTSDEQSMGLILIQDDIMKSVSHKYCVVSINFNSNTKKLLCTLLVNPSRLTPY